MIQRTVSIALLVLAAAGTTGCFTAELIEDMEPEYKPNIAIKVTDAWRDENDSIVVCVNGWPARRLEFPGLESFSFSMKPDSMDGSPEDAGPIPVYLVPGEQIERACPERPSGAEAIEIERVSGEIGDEFGEEADLPAPPDDALLADDASWRDGPVLFYIRDGLDAESPATLFYLHDAPLLEGSRLVRIALSEKDVSSSSALVLLLPLAIVVDVLTPVVCVLSILSASSSNKCN